MRFFIVYAYASQGTPANAPEHLPWDVYDSQHPDAPSGELVFVAHCHTKATAKMLAMSLNADQPAS